MGFIFSTAAANRTSTPTVTMCSNNIGIASKFNVAHTGSIHIKQTIMTTDGIDCNPTVSTKAVTKTKLGQKVKLINFNEVRYNI